MKGEGKTGSFIPYRNSPLTKILRFQRYATHSSI